MAQGKAMGKSKQYSWEKESEFVSANVFREKRTASLYLWFPTDIYPPRSASPAPLAPSTR